MRELWKPVVGYEDHYEVSSAGRVRRTCGGGCSHAGRPLSLVKDRRGYLTAHVSRYAIRKHLKVHRLVAAAFIGPPADGLVVNHRNGIKTDNRLHNLEYVTSSENQHHAFALGLKRPRYGASNPATKLTEQQVLQIRKRLATGDTQRKIANDFGVSQSNIYMISRGLTWNRSSSSHRRRSSAS